MHKDVASPASFVFGSNRYIDTICIADLHAFLVLSAFVNVSIRV